jgi:hypothetical protein
MQDKATLVLGEAARQGRRYCNYRSNKVSLPLRERPVEGRI